MKANTKVSLALGVALLIFFGFIYILTRPSGQSLAINALDECHNIKEVKKAWDIAGNEMTESEEYCDAVRKQLQSFQLKQTEIQEIREWLPPKTKNLNIIVVPDLSRRIRDTTNNPGQVSHDTAVLATIWRTFKKNVRLKINSKDRFLIDVADPSQAQQQFNKFANNLLFDLSEQHEKPNRLFFSKDIEDRYAKNVAALYNLALQNTSGADYVYYFTDKLPARIKKSTLEDDYRNILILITDGYLEIGKGNSISPNQLVLKKYAMTGQLNWPSPTATRDITYPQTEVYLFEINERQSGKGYDAKGLKKWWSDWLKEMHTSNYNDEFFFRSQDQLSITQDEIEGIFNPK